jgi:hypothetical protein
VHEDWVTYYKGRLQVGFAPRSEARRLDGLGLAVRLLTHYFEVSSYHLNTFLRFSPQCPVTVISGVEVGNEHGKQGNCLGFRVA